MPKIIWGVPFFENIRNLWTDNIVNPVHLRLLDTQTRLEGRLNPIGHLFIVRLQLVHRARRRLVLVQSQVRLPPSPLSARLCHLIDL